MDVTPGSPCADAGVTGGCRLLSINGHEINDVLDYRFYGSARRQHLVFETPDGTRIEARMKTAGTPDDNGLVFETYLMDRQKVCCNKCIFCFVEQMPKGLRKSLYFKDDDVRLSFLFGNYVTLTNMKQADVDRIVHMHISPVNISVHAMDPALRVKLLGNPRAGEVLRYIDDFARGGIRMNTQFVLCPGINDGEQLASSLEKLAAYGDAIASCAVVPVGLTAYREGLAPVRPYTPEEAAAVIDLTDDFNRRHRAAFGRNFVYASDEFFLKAGREMPGDAYYDDYPQLANGVGMWTLLKKECTAAFARIPAAEGRALIITGEAAGPLMRELAALANDAFPALHCDVQVIVNDYFGREITVAGLVTGTDIARQTGDLTVYDRVVIPDVMLRSDEDRVFLDDMTLAELEEKKKIRFTVTDGSGESLARAICGLA